MPKQIEGMPLSFKRRTAANHALRKTGFRAHHPFIEPTLKGSSGSI